MPNPLIAAANKNRGIKSERRRFLITPKPLRPTPKALKTEGTFPMPKISQILASVTSVKKIKAANIAPLSLEKFITAVKSEQFKLQISQLRSYKSKDPDKYRELKQGLPAVAFGAYKGDLTNHNYILNSSVIFNGDVDNLINEDLLHGLTELVNEHPAVVYSLKSPGGIGLKFGINVGAIRDDAHYKQLFDFMTAWVKKEIHPELILDRACKDIRRLCFVSHDPQAYLNLEAELLPTPEFFNLEPVKSEVKSELQQLPLQEPLMFNNLYSVQDDCLGVVTNMLIKAKAGDRHHTRLKVAKLAGGYVAGGLADKDIIWSRLIGVSNRIADNGITNPTELKALNDGFENGLLMPISRKEFLQENIGDTKGISLFEVSELCMDESSVFFSSDVRDGTATTRPLTEYGNAQRLIDSHACDVKYIEGASCFLHWNNNWQWDTEGSMTRSLAADLYKIIYREGEFFPQQGPVFAAWSRSSQSEKTIKATVSLYKDIPENRLPLQIIDGNQFMVGLDNARQIINLKTGEIRPAKRSDYITKSLNIREVGQAAKAQRWLQFLFEVFGNDPELIGWLQRLCGYILTGSTKEQFFLFCYGLGANGKSVLLDILRFILGDYGRAIASETLTDSKRAAGSASPDLADLIGARLALTTELEEGIALAESLIKALTGGDTLTARKLYSAPTQFTPQFKIIMSGNHKPLIKGNDHGIWRRVRLLPFTRIFSEEERDPNLSEKLRVEAPHILAWMVEGCLAWQKEGLADIPATIKSATADYKEDQDLIGAWLADCCQLSSQYESLSSNLYNNYTLWCATNGLMKSSNKVFGRRLIERGFTSRKSNGKQFWTGVEVIPYVFTV